MPYGELKYNLYNLCVRTLAPTHDDHDHDHDHDHLDNDNTKRTNKSGGDDADGDGTTSASRCVSRCVIATGFVVGATQLGRMDREHCTSQRRRHI